MDSIAPGTIVPFSRMQHPQPLSRYERQQVRTIAAWKGAPAGILARFLQGWTAPVTRGMQRMLRPSAGRMIEAVLERMAARTAERDSILRDPRLRRAGITSLQDLVDRPLEYADVLADYVIADARGRAVKAGVLTGFTSPTALAVGVPVAIDAALRAIHRIAQAYGYPGDTAVDRRLSLQTLALSLAVSRRDHERALRDYQRALADGMVGSMVEDTASALLRRIVIRVQLGTAVPAAGALMNAYLHARFVDKAAVAAKYVFQERWLRDHGKVAWIAPVTR